MHYLTSELRVTPTASADLEIKDRTPTAFFAGLTCIHVCIPAVAVSEQDFSSS